MKKTLAISTLTLVFLVLLDVMVAATLGWAERTGRLGSLVQYFEYGRSVPGKLIKWQTEPNTPGNLFETGWRPDLVTKSAASFKDEPEDIGPVIRSYGMSFVVNIRKQARALREDLNWDSHAGPAAPPNYTYALFEDDHANRRPGDIAIFGILSSGVSTMAALSNRTRVFEQPAPLTYPVYRPEGDGLRRVDPLVESAEAERALANDPDARAAWSAQLAEEDAFYSPVSFGMSWFDASPFARLIRRSLAKSHIETRIDDILNDGAYPYEVVLPRMIRAFAETARADGQIPVVMLLQTKNPRDPDLLALAKPVLKAHDIPYFASAEHFDPRDLSGFAADGHYKPQIDRFFAEQLLQMLGL